MADYEFRKKRRHEGGERDQRDEFQRDRDRILYSTAFRRLEGVTQIVRAGESDIFHDLFVHHLSGHYRSWQNSLPGKPERP